MSLRQSALIGCLALLAAAPRPARAAEDPSEALPGVVDLTPANFDKVVNGGKHALVEFYAPWCGHCKHLTPVLRALAEKVTASPKLASRVVIAKVNADEHRELGERYGVTGFPTLKFFPRGMPTTKPDEWGPPLSGFDYTGGRTADAFLMYINTRLDADKGFARIPTLDSLAQLFLSADDRQQALDSLVEGTKGISDATQRSAAELYSKYAKKSVEKGVDYFKAETARLERMLESGSVGSSKLGEISQKLSVLSAFVPEEASKLAADAKEAIVGSAEE